MIFSKTVKLKVDPAKYRPPKGIDVNWKLYHNELYATFNAGNINQVQYIRDRYDINEALAKLDVRQDTIKDYRTYRNVVPQSKNTVQHFDGNRVVIDKQG